jgi:hypothetical protein
MQSNLSQRREKMKKRVEYVEANILKKLFFKRKFLCFSHIKFVAQKLTEKKILNKEKAATTIINFARKRLTQNISKYIKKWRKCVEGEKMRILQQSKNIAGLRMKKYFTGT